MPSKHFTVVGHPVSHSKSPVLHQAAYRVLGLDFSYGCVDVEPGALAGFIESHRPVLNGLSVTMPLKREALAYAADCDWLARGTESVNTLVLIRDEHDVVTHVEGFNTDVYGIMHALRDADVSRAYHAAIVGAGATASSAIAALSELGVEHIDIFARNVDSAQRLQAVADYFATTIGIHPLTDMQRVDPVEVAICTVPGSVSLSLAGLPRENRAVLLDVAYNPSPSSRGAEWEVSGGISVSGLRMLAHQALIQVRLFVEGDGGKPLVREDEVRRAMFEAVGLE